jgi:hypothetical protein
VTKKHLPSKALFHILQNSILPSSFERPLGALFPKAMPMGGHRSFNSFLNKLPLSAKLVNSSFKTMLSSKRHFILALVDNAFYSSKPN